jgi:hypothetical protein
MGTIGRVTNSGEPRASVTVRSGTGAEREIEALIDTSFNGGLALPPHFIEALDLSLVGRERMLLASGDLQSSGRTEPTSRWRTGAVQRVRWKRESRSLAWHCSGATICMEL